MPYLSIVLNAQSLVYDEHDLTTCKALQRYALKV